MLKLKKNNRNYPVWATETDQIDRGGKKRDMWDYSKKSNFYILETKERICDEKYLTE